MPTTTTCQIKPLIFSSRSEKRSCLRGRGFDVDVVTVHQSLYGRLLVRHSWRSPERVSYVAPKPKICNICFMPEPSRASPLSELRSALPSLPMRLREVGRFVAANDYDATTRSMRELASVGGGGAASFSPLAPAAGFLGGDGVP